MGNWENWNVNKGTVDRGNGGYVISLERERRNGTSYNKGVYIHEKGFPFPDPHTQVLGSLIPESTK